MTVYLIDTKRLMIAEEATIGDVVRQLGKDNRTRIGSNESLKQQQVPFSYTAVIPKVWSVRLAQVVRESL